MGVRIIPEETCRKRRPDGSIIGNWGDVFVVMAFVAPFFIAVIVLAVKAYQHYSQ